MRENSFNKTLSINKKNEKDKKTITLEDQTPKIRFKYLKDELNNLVDSGCSFAVLNCLLLCFLFNKIYYGMLISLIIL